METMLEVLSSPPKLDQKIKQRFLKNIRSQSLYRRFSKFGDIGGRSQFEFRDMLSCSPDAVSNVIAMKFGRLLATAELTGEEDVIRFLKACKQEFSYLFDNPNKKVDKRKYNGGIDFYRV